MFYILYTMYIYIYVIIYIYIYYHIISMVVAQPAHTGMVERATSATWALLDCMTRYSTVV